MPAGPQLEIKRPTVFSPGAVVTMSLFGLVLFVPVVAAMLVVSVLQFGWVTLLVPVTAIGLATFFLPLGFGNPYVARLVAPLRPESQAGADDYLVQLTRVPRQRSGLWAVLEDADDIGWLRLSDSALVFVGDSLRLSVPYEHISGLTQRTAGWRALFAYGAQVSFWVGTMPEAGTFVFAERSSCLLPASRRIAAQMYRRLREKTPRSIQPAQTPLP